MASNKYCAFCYNLGIPKPHNHMIRDVSKSDKPITCPKLLEIECGYCHEKGHTTKYCGVLKEKNKMHLPKFKPPSEKKRVRVIDKDGFECVPCGFQNSQPLLHKPHKVHKVSTVGVLMSAFGALNVEGDSDQEEDGGKMEESDSDEEEHREKIEEMESIGEERTMRTSPFLTQQQLRDNLGIKLGTSWADEDESEYIWK